MRFKQIFPISLVAIGVAMASNFAPAQAESRTAPTLKISCISLKASDVSCSWTGIPPGLFTRWTLLRSDGRAFFTPPSQMSYTDALVKPGATYSYLVWAYNEGVGVARSDSAAVLVFGPDAVPTTLAPLEPPKVVVKPAGDAPTTTTIEAVKQEISILISTVTSKPPITTATTQPPVTEPAKTEPTTPGKTEPTRPPVTIPAPRLPEAPEATHAPRTTPATTPKAEITSDTKPADSHAHARCNPSANNYSRYKTHQQARGNASSGYNGCPEENVQRCQIQRLDIEGQEPGGSSEVVRAKSFWLPGRGAQHS